MADEVERTEQSQASSQEPETPIEQIRQLKIRIEELEKELAEEREKATDYMNRAMRAQAEISNARKRLQQDMSQAQLFGILHRTGVTPIEAYGKKFNPIEHEAVAYEDTNAYPEETITAELQRGYKLHDQVLRPALVKIAREPQTVPAGRESESEKSSTTE